MAFTGFSTITIISRLPASNEKKVSFISGSQSGECDNAVGNIIQGQDLQQQKPYAFLWLTQIAGLILQRN
jgi:hypothetical protein